MYVTRSSYLCCVIYYFENVHFCQVLTMGCKRGISGITLELLHDCRSLFALYRAPLEKIAANKHVFVEEVENALTVYCGGLPRALEILIDRLKVMNLDPNTMELSSLLEYIVDRITVRYHVSDLPCIESAVYMALYGKGVNLSDVVAGTMTVSDLFVCGYFVGSFGGVQSFVLPKMCPVMLHAWVLQMCKCDVKTSKAYHMAVCLFNMLQNMIVATGDSFEYVVAYHAVVMRYVYAAAMANKFPRLDEINWCSATLSNVYPIDFMWMDEE